MTQLTVIQSNTMPAMTSGSIDKSTELSKLLKEHLKNRPTPDNTEKRDTEIARMQNEAAVAEKNIRKLTQQIEEQQRERQGFKNDRQEKYEAMNAANNVLQGKKQEKDRVFQRLKMSRAGANALRVGRGGKESFRSVAELEEQIRVTERRMQTEVLTLREEKDIIRRLGEYRRMRPEVKKMEAKYAKQDAYKESHKDQEEADAQEYKSLKAEVEKAYQFQQSQYELFRVAMEADQELSDEISAAIQKRRDLYEAQKKTRDAVVTRRRDFQQSTRKVQQWQMQKRRLEDDIQRAARDQQRRERDGQMTRAREERRARQQAYREEEENERQAALEAKEDEPSVTPGETPAAAKPRTTPRIRAPRRVYVPRPRDPLERQKEQLTIIEEYVRTLAPQTASGSADVSVAAPASTGSRKGTFKPSRADEAPASLVDDLFKSTKKGKKSKRKRTKKVKQVLLIQAHTPPNVKVSMEQMGAWLSDRSSPLTLALPVRASDAQSCIDNIAAVREWVLDYPEAQKRAAEQAEQAEAEIKEDDHTEPTAGADPANDATVDSDQDVEPASGAEEEQAASEVVSQADEVEADEVQEVEEVRQVVEEVETQVEDEAEAEQDDTDSERPADAPNTQEQEPVVADEVVETQEVEDHTDLVDGNENELPGREDFAFYA